MESLNSEILGENILLGLTVFLLPEEK